MLIARRSFPLILLVFSVPALAQQEDRVFERSVYAIPSWDRAVEATDVERYSTADEYVAAALDDRYVLEKLRYRSDGLAVMAYLYRPSNDTPTKRPVIVFNRGSYIRGDIAPELLPMFHRLADAGFTIVAPMYRGSDGGEGHDEMGGADLNDLMNVAGLLSGLDSLDAQNVFLYGESRGGMWCSRPSGMASRYVPPPPLEDSQISRPWHRPSRERPWRNRFGPTSTNSEPRSSRADPQSNGRRS